MYIQTKALKKILDLKKRLKIIQGSSSAGKTIAILLILIDRAQCEKGKVFSVVSGTMPHLRRGAMRDFLAIMEAHAYFKENNWNRSDSIYTFETGTIIEFFSADDYNKVKGPRRDVLFINEADNIPFETFTQLEIRTNEDIYLDYNPVREFWVHTDLIPKAEHDFLILTYLDNDALSQNIITSLEARRGNKNWWRVYGEGQLGEVEGKIYKDWKVIQEIPHEARLIRRGLDFGYSTDPSAIVDIYKYNDSYILDELLYQKGLTNRQLADFLLQQPYALTIADSAEPKSIDELKGYGVAVIGASKGPGSVSQGIQNLQDKRISFTERSVNLQNEYRNYFWMTDKDGKLIPDEPDGGLDHLLDAVRYAMPVEIGPLTKQRLTSEQLFEQRMKEKRLKEGRSKQFRMA